MRPRFDNHRDAESRLLGTILFYQGKSFLVEGISPSLKLTGSIVTTGQNVTVSQEDPDLQYFCPPLGNINTEAGSFYVMRQPMRRWKQGIDMRALFCPDTPRPLLHRHLHFKGLAECLEGVYPSFEESLSSFQGRNPFKQTEKARVAFSREFSVSRTGALNYKNRQVGNIVRGVPELAEHSSWLQSKLEKVL